MDIGICVWKKWNTQAKWSHRVADAARVDSVTSIGAMSVGSILRPLLAAKAIPDVTRAGTSGVHISVSAAT